MSAWWVIVNPAAGRGTNLSESVASVLVARGVDHEIRISDGPKDVPAIVAEGRDNGYDSFVSVGGDGTANLVVNGLAELDWSSPPTLGILPAGSGSDFIRTFAIPDRLNRDHAGPNWFTIQVNGAGATEPDTAPKLRACEL